MNIKDIVKSGELIIGNDQVLKGLREGKIKKVFFASNCPLEMEERVKHYAGLASAETEKLNIPNDELGIICKKLFSISVFGVC